jgi:cytochrome c oxidase subunit 2
LGNNPLELVRLERGGRGLWFIYVGMGLTFLALFATAIWNYFVLAAVAYPPKDPAATIHVIAHQWWWEIQYVSPDPTRDFTTANEVHIPVGKPVRIELTTADVIHSFWVPALSGKMDTIPGQTNVTWMQADKPGVYRGQCMQFCGQEHALMGFLVTAESPKDFQAWWDRQLQAPQAPGQEQAAARFREGEQAFMRNCAVCHSIRGTFAQGKVGPNLSHLMERKSLGAATLPNSIGDLSGWIANPQQMKPGNMMPTLDLSAADLVAIRDYLETLN